MKTDPKDPKDKKPETDKREKEQEPDRPEYDDTVDYKNDDETDIDKDEYFEK